MSGNPTHSPPDNCCSIAITTSQLSLPNFFLTQAGTGLLSERSESEDVTQVTGATCDMCTMCGCSVCTDCTLSLQDPLLTHRTLLAVKPSLISHHSPGLQCAVSAHRETEHSVTYGHSAVGCQRAVREELRRYELRLLLLQNRLTGSRETQDSRVTRNTGLNS